MPLSKTPGFSVVVCTYNRKKYLKGCLDSLISLEYPNYEIIIVNDGSTDGTREFLDNFSATNKCVHAIHHERNQGLSAARNTGITHAKYDFIAFTDDDCQVDQHWLTHLAQGFTNIQTGFVIGQTFYVREGYHGYFPERLVSNIGAHWPMGCNIAYHKDVFNHCGNFDPALFPYGNEDTEMALRALTKNFTFTRSTQAIVRHQAALWTPKSLIRSARHAGAWPILKKRYPKHYDTFGSPILWGVVVRPQEYLFLLLSPALIPLLLLRYLWHSKRDLKIFFIKWPFLLIMRRYWVWREALRHRVWMF